MKTVFESAIRRGGYDLKQMLTRIDGYHVEGKLTDADRDELYALARLGASAAVSTDLWTKLAELERRIRALEGGSAAAGDYVGGRWYYAGDRVIFGGECFVCIAPEGAVCTWSPEEYPAYWEKVQ